MKRWEWEYSPYRLGVRALHGAKRSDSLLQGREGVLIRLRPKDVESQSWGYTDFFFWPELGDPALKEVLDRARSLDFCDQPFSRDTSLARLGIQSRLLFAQEDWDRRDRGVPAMSGASLLRNHFLIPSLLGESAEDLLVRLMDAGNQGFREVKVKVGRFLSDEARRLSEVIEKVSHPFLWRLDANESFEDADAFLKFWSQLSVHSRRSVEWVEDPTAQVSSEWQRIRDEAKVELARDFAKDDASLRDSYSVRVLKPARERGLFRGNSFAEPQSRGPQPRVCITSYLGHPLEQVIALSFAQRWSEANPGRLTSCGLMSHGVYHLNAYSSSLSQSGPILHSPPGLGWGWDSLLESESWESGGMWNLESLAFSRGSER